MMYIIFIFIIICDSSNNYQYEALFQNKNLYNDFYDFINILNQNHIKYFITQYNVQITHIPYMIKGNKSFYQNIIYERDENNQIIYTTSFFLQHILNINIQDIYINELKELHFNTGIIKHIQSSKNNYYLDYSYIYLNIKECVKITSALKDLISFIPINYINNIFIINNAFIKKYFELKNDTLQIIKLQYNGKDFDLLINDHNCLYSVKKTSNIYEKFCKDMEYKILSSKIDID